MKKLWIFILMISLSSTILFAYVVKSYKTASVNIKKVFESIDAKKEAEEQIELMQKNFDATIEKQNEEILLLQQGYDVLVSSITSLNEQAGKMEIVDVAKSTVTVNVSTTTANEDVDIKSLLNQRQEMFQRIEELKQNLVEYEILEKENIENAEKDYLYNITGQIYDEISHIAKKYGYNVIFNKKDLIYAKKNEDITELIISEINKG